MVRLPLAVRPFTIVHESGQAVNPAAERVRVLLDMPCREDSRAGLVTGEKEMGEASARMNGERLTDMDTTAEHRPDPLPICVDTSKAAKRRQIGQALALLAGMAAITLAVFFSVRYAVGEAMEARRLDERFEAAASEVTIHVDTVRQMHAHGLLTSAVSVDEIAGWFQNSLAPNGTDPAALWKDKLPFALAPKGYVFAVLWGDRPIAYANLSDAVCANRPGRGIRFTPMDGLTTEQATDLQDRIRKAFNAPFSASGTVRYTDLFGTQTDTQAREGAPASPNRIHLCVGD